MQNTTNILMIWCDKYKIIQNMILKIASKMMMRYSVAYFRKHS